MYVGSLDGSDSKRVRSATSVAVYADPTSLLWVEEGVLVAQPFDATRAVLTGEPIPVVQGVGLDEAVYRGAFAVSATAVLAHRTGRGEGTQPRWSPDGKELFYVGLDGRMMAVPIAVRADRQLEPGTPVELFRTRLAAGPNINSGGLGSSAQYAVARDGRFLMNVTVEPAAPTPITVVLNWTEELKRRVPRQP